MKFLASIFITLSALLPTCNDDSTALTNSECPDVLVNVSHLDDFPDDPFTIEDARVEGDNLKVVARYGGGCGDTHFTLVAHSYFMESNPVQAALTISFKDDDLCKALITEELCFDLLKLAHTYQTAYQVTSGTINLRLAGYEPIIHYTF